MKYLICNLKAHKNIYDMLLYRDNLRNINFQNLELIIAPTSIYLPLFLNENLSLATQNLDLNAELNLTGDININQLKSLNVKYTIIGHYERRKYYQENETTIIKKINMALKNGLKVIYCIGETKEELLRHVEYQVLEKSIARILNNVPSNFLNNIIIAYEPTYLIGGKEDYNIKKITETINFIKDLITNYYHNNIKVVYGGNITLDNLKDFLSIKNLDGFIIGNTINNPANLETIIYKLTNS